MTAGVACLALVMLSAAGSNAGPIPGEVVGSFTLQERGGKPSSWSPGRTTVLTFCAYWCDTWKQQLPALERSLKTLQGLPVDHLTISVDGRWAELAPPEIAGRKVLADVDSRLTRSLGVDRIPCTIVVDPQGSIRTVNYGTLHERAISGAIRAAMAPPPPQGVVYLTFDDFPSETVGEELLDLLRAEQTPATFFVIARHVESRKSLVRRAHSEGHSLQLHSWDHAAAKPELERSAKTLKEITGAAPTLYRPPGSNKIFRLAPAWREMALPVVDPYDYARPGEEELVRRIALKVKDRSVIQLHAGVDQTVGALRRLIPILRRRGFGFERLE